MRVIQILIGPDGSCRIEAKGYTGSDCIQATKTLEAALGRRSAEQLTADYYTTTQTQAQEAHQ